MNNTDLSLECKQLVPEEWLPLLFSGYDKAHYIFTQTHIEDGKIKGNSVCIREPLDLAAWRRHLSGGPGVSVIPLREDNKVLFGAIDVDDRSIDLAAFEQKVKRLKLPLVVCRSKSGGAHAYLFLKEPAPAVEVVELLGAWAERLGHRACEVFPKQTVRLNDEEVGNGLNVAYASGDATTRYAIRDGQQLTLAEFLDFAEASRVSLSDLARTWDDDPDPAAPARDGTSQRTRRQPGGRNDLVSQKIWQLIMTGILDEHVLVAMAKAYRDTSDDPHFAEKGRDEPTDQHIERNVRHALRKFGKTNGKTNGAHCKPLQLDRITAAALMEKTFDPINYVVPGYIPEGLTLLAGAPKIGKSWLVLDFAVAVALGGHALGSVKVGQSDVLYMALEDNQRRLQERIQEIIACMAEVPNLGRLTLQTRASGIDDGLVVEIDDWRESVESPRLVIIDVLARVKPQRKNTEATYDHDYKALAALQEWAAANRTAVVVVHHTRKSPAEDDPLDAVSGTLGLNGASDTVCVLLRANGRLRFHGRGRDIEGFDVIVDRDAGRWKILGTADEVGRSEERKAVLDALREAGAPMNPTEIAEATGKTVNCTKVLLHRMVKNREVGRGQRGQYSLAQSADRVADDDIPF